MQCVYQLEYDGAAKGNPGKAGAGALLRHPDGSIVETMLLGLGLETNNFAEYYGLIIGLRGALARNITHIRVQGDSTLVCKQMQGRWAVRNEKLKPLHQEALRLSKRFAQFSISQVGREFNSAADALADKAARLSGSYINIIITQLKKGIHAENADMLQDGIVVSKSSPMENQTSDLSKDCCVYQLEYDGASKGNPGKSGAGALLRHPDGSIVEKMVLGLGLETNNFAEYSGLIIGLRGALARNISHIRVQGDSTLVCKQMQGIWSVNTEKLKPLHKEAIKLSKRFLQFNISHIRREHNSAADALANKAATLPDTADIVRDNSVVSETTLVKGGDVDSSKDGCIYQLEYDGSSKGNPGKSGAGALLRHPNGSIVAKMIAGLGLATSNFAEYQGLIIGLRGALSRNITRIRVQGDSNLVYKQIQGSWKVRNEMLRPLHEEATRLSKLFTEFSIAHVGRELNSDADALANEAVSVEESDELIEIHSEEAEKIGAYSQIRAENLHSNGAATECAYILEYGGASRGNPGQAGAGALLRHPDGSIVEEMSSGLGVATSNFAEYRGLILGLRGALARNIREIQAQGDSNLVYKQIQGKWSVRSEKLKPLHEEATRLCKQFEVFSICHVPRELNSAADALANIAVDLPGDVEAQDVNCNDIFLSEQVEGNASKSKVIKRRASKTKSTKVRLRKEKDEAVCEHSSASTEICQISETDAPENSVENAGKQIRRRKKLATVSVIQQTDPTGVCDGKHQQLNKENSRAAAGSKRREISMGASNPIIRSRNFHSCGIFQRSPFLLHSHNAEERRKVCLCRGRKAGGLSLSSFSLFVARQAGPLSWHFFL